MKLIRVKQILVFLFPLAILSLVVTSLALFAAPPEPASGPIPPLNPTDLLQENVSWGTAAGSYLFYTSYGTLSDPFPPELWRTQGTITSTIKLKTFAGDIYGLTNFHGILIFAASDGVTGSELWRSDGTEAGTYLIKDIHPEGPGSYPHSMFISGDTLFFVADDGTHGPELWKTDGTAVGTSLVKDIYPGSLGSNPRNYYALDANGLVVFNAYEIVHGRELWVTNGLRSGTQMIADIYPGQPSSWPTFADEGWDTAVLFGAAYDNSGVKLWKTDGTSSGTTLVKDIYLANWAGSYPLFYGMVNNNMLFYAYDDTHGFELWRSNGTTDGTVLVKDINPGVDDSFPPYALENLVMDGKLYFQATEPTHGQELWASDGTEAGTTLVKDINPGSASSFPLLRAAIQRQLFMFADDGVHGRELWVSDGTAVGTTLVKDINPNGSAILQGWTENATAFDIFFFSASDGQGLPDNNRDLWASTGTATTTIKIMDHNVDRLTGSLSPYPAPISLETILYYGLNNTDLWSLTRSDILHLFLPNTPNNYQDYFPLKGNIVFASDRNGSSDLYTMALDGSGLRQLTNDDYGNGDSACAVDSSIAFTSYQDNGSSLYLIDYQTGIISQPWGANLVGEEPTWSPDSQAIAYASNGDLFRIQINGTGLQQLTTSPAQDQDAAWSPDGSRIAFASNRSGAFQIYVMDAAGGNITQITMAYASAKEPSWSPDGQTITFHSDVDGDQEIYSLNLNTLTVTKLTDNTAQDTVPEWSPDGRFILFESNRDGNNELYVMLPNGENETRITNNRAFDWGGCWYRLPKHPLEN